MPDLCSEPTVVPNSRLVHTIQACTLIAGCMTIGGAFAATLPTGDPTPPTGDDTMLTEVVVSANRIGDVSLQRLPMAISVQPA